MKRLVKKGATTLTIMTLVIQKGFKGIIVSRKYHNNLLQLER